MGRAVEATLRTQMEPISRALEVCTMPGDRTALPQLAGEPMLTDSGMETDLIFHHGWDLPHFAAFPLVDHDRGAAFLRDYYRAHALVGRLPDGTTLADAIRQVDELTEGGPAYYGINCAHPSHFASLLEPGAAWVGRLRMVRANASRRSHAELDQAEELDDGDPVEFGREHAALRAALPQLAVLGGCCGTDLRHVKQIAESCFR